MQSTSRTFASLAGTMAVVLLTILLAAWFPPHTAEPRPSSPVTAPAR